MSGVTKDFVEGGVVTAALEEITSKKEMKVLGARERIQLAVADVSEADLDAYALKLEEFEQQVGMTVESPAHIQKFIMEMRKVTDSTPEDTTTT